MSRWLPDRLRVRRVAWGVDAHGIAWQESGMARELSHEDDAVAHALQAAGSAGVEAIAANELAVHWLQQPPQAIQSLQELRLVAQARCAHLHGGRPDDWWVAGDWTVDRPFVCAALPRAVVQPLQDRCDRQGIRVRWHTVWSLLARHRPASLPNEGWCGMRTASRALLWHCKDGQVTTLTGFAIDRACSGDELQELARG